MVIQTQHRDLTGASLHEPKGVASAAANRVYVADGLGSGSWSQITSSTVDSGTLSALNPFSNQFMHVQEVQATTVAGSAASTGSWETRVINTTQINLISGASLGTNRITLPAGTYLIMVQASASGVGNHQIRLRNITDAATTLVGISAASNTAEAVVTLATLNSRFTIADTKQFEIQHRVSDSGFYGRPNSFGENEVYLDAVIWKVA